MPTYKMTLAYDGTAYGGWQIQPNAPSIQGLVEDALSTVLRKKTSITGSGRTDAGVHALGQVAHFTFEDSLNLYKVSHGINGLLPPDIRILMLEEVEDTFHARYQATGKIYHYHLHLDRVVLPFKRLYAWHVPCKVDMSAMKEAALLLLGTHDFTAFASEAHKGAAAKNGVRSLYRIDFVPEEGGIRLEFEGNGFLYKMVRSLTGTLIDVGAGLFSSQDIPTLLASKDRKKTGQTAPPQGLFLVEVHYDKSSKKELKQEAPSTGLEEMITPSIPAP